MTDQPPPPAAPQPVPPFAPMEGAAAGKRSRTPLVIGIVLALVAAGVVVFLLAGDDDEGGDASGAGELSGVLPGPDGIITREVTLPAGSVLVVRAEPTTDELDIAVSILGQPQAYAGAAQVVRGLRQELPEVDPDDVDEDVTDALEAMLDAAEEENVEVLEENEADEDVIDGLPPSLLLHVDREYDLDTEVFLFLAVEEVEITVAFTGYGGEEGDFDATLTIVEVDQDRAGIDAMIDAIYENEEIAELVG